MSTPRHSARLAAKASAISSVAPVEPLVILAAELSMTKEQKKEAQKMKRREKDTAEREERKADGRKTRRILFTISISSLVTSILCVGAVAAIAATCPWWGAVVAAVVGGAAVCGLFYLGGGAYLMAGQIDEY